MRAQLSDTIVARATPAGRGGVAIVRISGPAVRAIADALLAECPEPRHATLRDFRDGAGEAIDTGLALFFPAPRSFTGEDVLELHGHGGVVVSDLLVERVIELGARLARPGEFSQRAFLNDRIDLLQAEAIADLIDSGSRAAARAAQRSLQGKLSELVLRLNDRITELRIHVEAAIDFPEEEIDFLSDDVLLQRIKRVAAEFASLEHTVRQGRLLREGVQLVLAGRPNSGKSSLLNALAGYDAAIVTAVPGTTRDVIREHLDIDGLPVNVLDTAGLRDAGDLVEMEGMRRTRRELAVADLALLVEDARSPSSPDQRAALLAEVSPGTPVILIRNMIDLTGDRPGQAGEGPTVVNISASTGAGLDELRRLVKASVGYAGGDGTLTARRRHLDALGRARAHFEAGRHQLEVMRAGELLAEELREAQTALAEITGEFTSDDLLGEIFSRFCIGK